MSSTGNVLKYKEYWSKINFSAEDGILYGEIEGINDLITFEGHSVEEIKSAFHEAVDYYEELCKETGKEPEKAYSGTFNVRISPELHRKVALNSSEKGISINEYINYALQEMVDRAHEVSSPITIEIKPVSPVCPYDSPHFKLIEGGQFRENTSYSIQ